MKKRCGGLCVLIGGHSGPCFSLSYIRDEIDAEAEFEINQRADGEARSAKDSDIQTVSRFLNRRYLDTSDPSDLEVVNAFERIRAAIDAARASGVSADAPPPTAPTDEERNAQSRLTLALGVLRSLRTEEWLQERAGRATLDTIDDLLGPARSGLASNAERPRRDRCTEDEHFWPLQDTGRKPTPDEPCNCGARRWRAKSCGCPEGQTCADCDPEGTAYPPTQRQATWLDDGSGLRAPNGGEDA